MFMHIYAFWHCGELLSFFLALVHMFALCVFAFDYQERRRCEEIGLLLDEALYLLLDDGVRVGIGDNAHTGGCP